MHFEYRFGAGSHPGRTIQSKEEPRLGHDASIGGALSGVGFVVAAVIGNRGSREIVGQEIARKMLSSYEFPANSGVPSFIFPEQSQARKYVREECCIRATPAEFADGVVCISASRYAWPKST